MEDNAVVVGVAFVFSTNSHHQIKRGIVAAVEVVLDGVVEFESEGVAGLVGLSERNGSGAV